MRAPGALDKRLAELLDFETVALAAALRSPMVEAARQRWQATVRQFDQAEYLETLIAQFRTFTRYLDVPTGEPLNKAMAQSFFPYPSVIALKGDLVREQVRLAELDWQQTLRDTAVMAGEIYYEYQYQVRAEAATRDNAALVQDLVSVIEQRNRVGVASQADLIKIQTELERQRTMLKDLASGEHSSRAKLNGLLGRPPDSPLGPPMDKDMALPKGEEKALLEEANTLRQELSSARSRVKQMEIEIRMGEVMSRPLASQGYSLFERGMEPEASEGMPMEPYGEMRKAVDRPAYAQAEAYLAEMRKRLEAERAMLAQAEADTAALARSLTEELDIAQRGWQLASEIVLPQARSAFETTQAAYESSKMGFLDLLDSERMLVEAQLELHSARKMLNMAILNLAKVRGRM